MKHRRSSRRIYKGRKYNSSRNIILIIVAVIAGVSLISAGLWHNKQKKLDSKQSELDAILNIEEPESSMEESSVSSESSSVPEEEPEESDIYNVRAEFSGAIAQKEKEDNNYFKDALFIGDSFAKGIDTYLSTVIPNSGIKVLSEEYFKEDKPEPDKTSENESGTEEKDASEIEVSTAPGGIRTFVNDVQDSYSKPGKIYLAFGSDWMSLGKDDFLSRYTELIRELRGIYSVSTTIYICGLPSVSAEYDQSGEQNQMIYSYNLELMALAANLGVAYLDTPVVFMDNNSVVYSDATSDGVHIIGSYYFKWFDYIKRHTA